MLIQQRGVNRTLSGRVLAWPNTLQHCVQPFELENKALPGRRTILCFFLVDPTKRIRSTATVPPQQREWLQLEARALINSTFTTITICFKMSHFRICWW